MRIGIDARELCGRSTGVGRYLGGLLHEWAAEWAADGAERRHEVVLYAPEPIPLEVDTRRFATRIVPGSAGTWWEQVHVPPAAAADHLDVWFSPAYTAPLRLTVPIVVAIHDLSFIAHPEWFRFRERTRRRWLTGRAASQAAAVITISQFSRRELVERLGVPNAKIHVVPPGIEPRTCTSVARPNKVLFVGSIFNRRHVRDLIRAFAPIARARPDASLDIVGDDRSYPSEDPQRTIDAERLQAQVTWHRYVTDDQLRRLYQEARAFAFLSEYEGLGLTPLEALAAGVPPVLLDTAVARESCGEAALYVGLGDLRATTAALETALYDEAARTRLLAAAPRELAKYRWPQAARDTLRVIEAAQIRPTSDTTDDGGGER